MMDGFEVPALKALPIALALVEATDSGLALRQSLRKHKINEIPRLATGFRRG
jgi:hypothetical protein